LPWYLQDLYIDLHAKVIELKFQTNLVSTIEQRINTFHKLGELF